MIPKATTILRRRDVEARIGLKTSALYVMVQAGEFPKPVRLSKRRVGWVEAEVEAWIQARLAARDATMKRVQVSR